MLKREAEAVKKIIEGLREYGNSSEHNISSVEVIGRLFDPNAPHPLRKLGKLLLKEVFLHEPKDTMELLIHKNETLERKGRSGGGYQEQEDFDYRLAVNSVLYSIIQEHTIVSNIDANGTFSKNTKNLEMAFYAASGIAKLKAHEYGTYNDNRERLSEKAFVILDKWYKHNPEEWNRDNSHENLDHLEEYICLNTKKSLKASEQILTKDLLKNDATTFQETVKAVIKWAGEYSFLDKASDMLLEVLKHAHNLNPNLVNKEINNAINLTKKENTDIKNTYNKIKNDLGIKTRSGREVAV